jgi:outer membrane receptor for monomeric catechols
VNVVTADQITQQGAESVAEALQYTPNVLTNYRGE